MARQAGEWIGRVDRARDVRNAGGHDGDGGAVPGGGDGDERERERQALAGAQVRGGARRRGKPDRCDELPGAERDE